MTKQQAALFRFRQKQTNSFCINDTEAEHPREVVAKIDHKGTATVSKINQIYESDCFNRFLSFGQILTEARFCILITAFCEFIKGGNTVLPRVRGMIVVAFRDFDKSLLSPPRAWNDFQLPQKIAEAEKLS